MAEEPINETTGEIVAANTTEAPVFKLDENTTGVVRTTVNMDSFEGRMSVFDATQNALPLEEHLNEDIELTNITMQGVQINDREHGGVIPGTRTILMASDGTAYTTVSESVKNAVFTLFSIAGMPDKWPNPIKVKVQRVKGNNGYNFYKFVPQLKKTK